MESSDKLPFIISLGSNLPSSEANANLDRAEVFLKELFKNDIVFSSHYESPGVGSGKGKTYLNSVAKGYTNFDFSFIRSTLKDFEKSLGRSQETKSKGIVPIDLDLLTLGDDIFKERDLSQDYVVRGLQEIK